VTGKPYILPRRATDVTTDSVHTLTAPMEVVIYAPTQGASIAYTTDQGENARWKLYTGPIRVESPVVIRAKAIRYGYKESDEARARFAITSAASEGS
jgi:N-sulfoglucosamine sulfohydrolase